MGEENASRSVYLGLILLRPQHFLVLVRAQYGRGKRRQGFVFGADSSAAAALLVLSSGSVWERKTLAGVCI